MSEIGRTSVESSKFRSEFTVTNNALNRIEELYYKLHMFGVPIYGSTNILCDNGTVCVKMTRPKLTLSKNHHSIAYHFAQEAFAEVMFGVSK